MGMLDGRVVIVTGGGRGIGREHCLELGRQGACVLVNDLGVGVHGEGTPESPADEVTKEIEAAGGVAAADGTSVTDWNGVAALIERTVELFGRLDAVVNNAGIVRDRMITSMTESDWDAVIDVHLKGTFNLTKHACDHWRARAKAGEAVSGRIVNTTSGTGLFGNVGQAAYGAAKAAIANLTVITAMEMERYGVTANAISPIAFTRMVQTMPSMKDYRPDPDWDPLDPANPSPLVAWLASEGSGWLSGAVLRLEGNTVSRVRGWEVDANARHTAVGGGRLDPAELSAGLRRAFGVLPRTGPASSGG